MFCPRANSTMQALIIVKMPANLRLALKRRDFAGTWAEVDTRIELVSSSRCPEWLPDGWFEQVDETDAAKESGADAVGEHVIASA